METEIIDNINDPDQASLIDALKWWEKKRPWFNVFVGTAGLLGMAFFAPGVGAADIINALFYGIIVNVFYSMGFVLEALNLYYFKGNYTLHKYRFALFLTGTIFSFLVTFVGAAAFYMILYFP